MEAKPFYKSKTFWFNLLVVIVTAAVDFVADAEVFSPDELIIVVAVANIVLRFVTSRPVILSGTNDA